MRTVAGKWMLAMTALAGLAGGCPAPSYVEPGRMERGLVVVLPGIEGTSAFNAMVAEGLAAGNIKYAIEIYDWTAHWNPVLNLQDEVANRRKASELAGRIAAYQDAYPGRPVFLVGQSGGGAIAVWTAEAMPEGHAVEGVVLLAAALSPGYRLDKALGHSRRGIVSFYSAGDWVLLSVGTRVFTTMDGQHSESAGRDGFASPPTEAYQKLYQIGWDSSMVSAGHIGLHLTSGAGEFVQYYVAPLILCGRWDSEVTGRVARGEWIDPRQYPAAAASAPAASAPGTR
ncbi:MAG: alpha/beta hydrolase [Planctomycetota bacterium]|nr:alpha/beta hydrolase [Planctomycetota bacterium]